VQIITSRQNSTVKDIRKLLRRKARKKTGLCLVEGIQAVLCALENRVPLQWIVVAPDLLTSEVAKEAVAAAEERGEQVLRVSPDVFASFSSRDAPNGLAAVARAQYASVNELPVEPATILTVLFDVSDPGNLGTIARSVDAMGSDGLILVGKTTDPYDPKAIRASVGTVFRVPIVRLPAEDALLSFARRWDIQLIATSAHAPSELDGVRLRTPCAVLMGSEREGLSSQLLRTADVQVRIPMGGGASSLNLAVASGIILYELRRRITS